jgi:hypothetical protein
LRATEIHKKVLFLKKVQHVSNGDFKNAKFLIFLIVMSASACDFIEANKREFHFCQMKTKQKQNVLFSNADGLM